MLKAVLSHGEIHPLEPLPSDWQDGQALSVQESTESESPMPIEQIDQDFAALTSMCQTSELADEEQLERALQEARRLAKEHVRQQIGLA